MSRKRRSRKYRDEINILTEALYMNGVAKLDGGKRKHWTKHDIRVIKPLTPAQEEFFHSFFQGDQICACGSAGTGKTFIALYLALNEVVTQQSQNKIVIVRSAATAREQGFLPGTQEEKDSPFENPYRDMMANLCGRDSTYDDMKESGLIKFMTTAHLRGLTWDNSIVIVDEVQNMNFHEINTVITRLGENSRIIIAGDYRQDDLVRRPHDKSGFHQMMKVIERMDCFSTITFTVHDIVRGALVKEWIMACEDVGVDP